MPSKQALTDEVKCVQYQAQPQSGVELFPWAELKESGIISTELTNEVTQDDEYSESDASLSKEDATPLVLKRELDEVLLHELWHGDPVILRGTPTVFERVGAERFRHGEHLQPAQRKPRGGKEKWVRIEVHNLLSSPITMLLPVYINVTRSATAPPKRIFERRKVLPLLQSSKPNYRMEDYAPQDVPRIFCGMLRRCLQTEGSTPDGKLNTRHSISK